MINCLSCTNWINPQIDFLLFLQNIRICHFECLDNLFLSVTALGEVWIPTLICAIVYWCIDTKLGIFLFSLSSLNVFLAQLFKMIACVYRPWVLSDKVHPVDKAYALAKGYSFPSGHSAKAAAVFGGLAYFLRNKKFISAFLVILVLFVGFSRMWLGVHTPQDVVVGLLIGFLLVFVMDEFIEKAEKNTNLYIYFLFAVDFVALLALIFVCYFNNYPADYINGTLLVDPRSSIQTFILCYGYLLGIINGAYLCRKFFSFDAKAGSVKSKIIRGFIGAFCIYLMFHFVLKSMFCNPMNLKAVFVIPFVIGFFITAVYPYIFSRFCSTNNLLN